MKSEAHSKRRAIRRRPFRPADPPFGCDGSDIPTTCGVYVLHAEGTPFYKIGYSSDFRSRIKALRTASPVHLRLVAIVRGGRMYDEFQLHWEFEATRHHGEWFRESPELLAYIAEHAL